MSDIGPGDVVVCVNARRIERALYFATGAGLEEGRTYRVTALDCDGDDGAPTLWLAGMPRDYLAERFRKIRPASDEFTATIRACKPIRQREDA